MGRACRPRPRLVCRPCGDWRRRSTTRPDRSWRRPRARAAGSRGWLLTALVEPEEQAVVAALDLPLDTVVGHVLDLHRRGFTMVLTLDPAGCTVVILIG